VIAIAIYLQKVTILYIDEYLIFIKELLFENFKVKAKEHN